METWFEAEYISRAVKTLQVSRYTTQYVTTADGIRSKRRTEHTAIFPTFDEAKDSLVTYLRVQAEHHEYHARHFREDEQKAIALTAPGRIKY